MTHYHTRCDDAPYIQKIKIDYDLDLLSMNDKHAFIYFTMSSSSLGDNEY